MAIIVNAKDFKKDTAEREFKLNNLKDYLEDFGFKATFVDLKNYLNAKEVEAALRNYDLIWAAGGNTFVLLHEMVRSGFDKAIKFLLADDIVYGGESAGAVVAGISLKGIELADDPDEAKGVIWEGLGLVERIIVPPHADNVEFQDNVAKIKALHRSSKKLIILNDNQALVINGNIAHLVEA